MDREKIINKIKTLDEKISMKHVLDNLKYKRFKKVELTIRLMTLALTSGFIGADINQYTNKPDNTSSIYSSIDTINLSDANDEVVIDYLNNSFSKFSDYISTDANANEKIEAIKLSYLTPALESYTDYKETNDEKYHERFKKIAKEYESAVVTYNSNFSFDKSIYKYAKSIDGNVYVPYSGVIDNSTLPNNYKIDNNIIYIPINDNGEIKSLGND